MPQQPGGRIQGLRVKPFAGTRSRQVYKDWKRELQAIRLASKLPDKEVAVYAWLALEGEAKRLVRHLDVETEGNHEDGIKKLLACLDKRAAAGTSSRKQQQATAGGSSRRRQEAAAGGSRRQQQAASIRRSAGCVMELAA